MPAQEALSWTGFLMLLFVSHSRKIQLLSLNDEYDLGQIAILYRMRNVSSVFEKRLKEYVTLTRALRQSKNLN